MDEHVHIARGDTKPAVANNDADEWQVVSRGGARKKKTKKNVAAATDKQHTQQTRDHSTVHTSNNVAAACTDTSVSGYKYREQATNRARRRHDPTTGALDGCVSSARRTGIERRVAQIALALRTSPLVLDAVRAIAAHWQLPPTQTSDTSDVANAQSDSDATLSPLSSPSVSQAPAPSPPLSARPTPTRSRTALHIVSYGLGSFCASSNAVYQLAYARALLDALEQCVADDDASSVIAEIFDPVMTPSDESIAAHFGLATIATNECGRRAAAGRTIFFMPHCGKTLYENVLASNWRTAALADVVIIGNSFEAYGDRLLDASERHASAIVGVLPYLSETSLRSGLARSHDEFVQYEAAFNDLSVLTFPVTQAHAALQDAPLALRMAAIARAEDSPEFDDGELIRTQQMHR